MELKASCEATLGQHIIAEFSECNSNILRDLAFIREALFKAAEVAEATVLDSSFYHFGNGGVSGVVIIAESHLSIHTWPECGYAACDFYTCGSNIKPEEACRFLVELLQSGHGEYLTVRRGIDCGKKQYGYKID
ncbi:TPA: adenosylmethionine decarboxylase [bacterium UBP9_UBA11836]|nr:adenosylmethionine decarboxylase [bacterium UBP9_UBA11836]